MKRKTIAMACLMALTAQGGWQYEGKTDPLYDTDTSYVMTATRTGKEFLMFTMLPDGVGVLVGHNRHLRSNGGKLMVEYRFDKEAPVGPARWDAIEKATYPPSSQVNNFKHKVLTCKTLAVRVTDRDGESVTMIFDLTDEDGSLKTFFMNHDKGERQ